MSGQRIALVTGASRGIGRAVARELAARGWRVICIARAQKALETLDDEIKADGKGEATLVPLDLRDGAAIDQLGPALYERFQKLDGLAACAGVLGALTPAHQASAALMNEITSVNYTANQRLLSTLHPLLRGSDAGRAVFLSSSVARAPRAYWGPYAASKAALETLVACYAAENGITPIRANLFNPGPVRTPMRAKAYPGEDPLTLPTPEEVAPSIADLLEPSVTQNGELFSFERGA